MSPFGFIAGGQKESKVVRYSSNFPKSYWNLFYPSFLQLTTIDTNQSFKDLALCPQETLFVEER